MDMRPQQGVAVARDTSRVALSDQFAQPYSLFVKALLGLRHYLVHGRPFERKTPEAIADYQLKRLQRVVRVAAERVPFYRRRVREAVLMQTSGTTGEPTQFVIPRQQTVIELAYHWRFWLWAGYRPGSRIAAFRHYTPQESEPISRYERSSNTLFFSVHDMYESRLAEYVDVFN